MLNVRNVSKDSVKLSKRVYLQNHSYRYFLMTIRRVSRDGETLCPSFLQLHRNDRAFQPNKFRRLIRLHITLCFTSRSSLKTDKNYLEKITFVHRL